eukprot:scaffold10.g2392.t1
MPWGEAWEEAFAEASTPPIAAIAGHTSFRQHSSRALEPAALEGCRADEAAEGWEPYRKELGEAELSACILATSLFNVTGLSVLSGFSAALETLAGQAFGARNYRLVGVALQRAIVIVTLLTACLAAIWTRSESLLLLARQEPAIAALAARYILRLTPALWFCGLSEAFKRYLMAQGTVRPVTAVTVLALLLAPAVNFWLVFGLGLGLDGAAYAVDVVQFVMAAGLGCIIAVRDWLLRGEPRATWHGWSADALRGWGEYARFALPSVVMICVEWWTYESVILMSGWLENPAVAVAVAGIAINTSGMVFVVMSGISQALSVRVSHSLGAGCPRAARRATLAAVGMQLALTAALIAGFVAGRCAWPTLFTDLPTIVAATTALMPLFALTLPGDNTNAVLQGLLRGAGEQEKGAVTNLVSYWCFGIPCAALLAFRLHLGLEGLWLGLVAVNWEQARGAVGGWRKGGAVAGRLGRGMSVPWPLGQRSGARGLVMLAIAAKMDYKAAAERAAARFGIDDAGEAGAPLLGPGAAGEEGRAPA